VLALDTSFEADRIYQLNRTGRSFILEEASAKPPVRKSYRVEELINALPSLDWAQVASDSGTVVGLATMSIEGWNRRAVLHHLYVAPSARRQGVGRALVEAAMTEARYRDTRCLWVETQTVNYGAIRFYERAGFSWSGFDTSLYDPGEVDARETALFFSRTVE